jgi:hypothetical protein
MMEQEKTDYDLRLSIWDVVVFIAFKILLRESPGDISPAKLVETLDATGAPLRYAAKDIATDVAVDMQGLLTDGQLAALVTRLRESRHDFTLDKLMDTLRSQSAAGDGAPMGRLAQHHSHAQSNRDQCDRSGA